MTKAQQRRLVHWRLKILRHAEETENVSQTCRYFGISRPTFHKCRTRYEENERRGRRPAKVRALRV